MRRLNRADEGATLVVVLIITTVIAVVLGVTLSLVDTNVRSTVHLRDQGVVAYTADGAGQAAVNQLRTDVFNGVAGGCDATTTEVLSNFYPSVNGQAGASAAVHCVPDPSNVGTGGGANTSPGSALLTLGTGQGGEDGIWDGSVNNRTFKVSGGIFSNSNINLGNKSGGVGAAGNGKSVIENVSTNSYVFAMGACSGPGAILVTGTTKKTCNYSTNPVSANDRRRLDPQLVPGHGTSFDPPAAPTSVITPPACTGKKVYELQPGLYRDATLLNALTDSGNSGPCGKSVVHFNPGTYYFDFTNGGTHRWRTSSAYVVGGTPTSTLKTNPAPQMTAANPSCVAPGKAGATTSSGVLFVFGGDSRMDYTSSGTSDGNLEICASNAASGPPVAIYGLKSSIGSGALQVSALGSCITATPYIYGGDSSHCALIQSYMDPTPIFTVRGTVYAPTAPIDITFNNSAAQYFQWGLVARTILVSSTGSADALSNSVISVPDDAPAPFALPNIYYVDVTVCQGSSTCTASANPNLRAKIQVTPGTATTAATVTVLSWTPAN